MKEIKIYNNKKINDFNELFKLMPGAVPGCYNPPQKGICTCNKCFEYKITMEEIKISNIGSKSRAKKGGEN